MHSSITLTLARPWVSRFSPLYRYTKAEYAAEFFKTGRLWINTFAAFRRLPGEALRDEDEGQVHIMTHYADKQFSSFQTFDRAAYVMCMSRELSRALMERFGATAILKIRQPLEFAAAVAGEVAGFTGGMDGDCEYVEEPTVQRIADAEFARIAGTLMDHETVDLEQVHDLSRRQFGDDIYFRKHISYAADREFRMLWFTTNGDAPFNRNVPDARQFCELIDPADLH